MIMFIIVLAVLGWLLGHAVGTVYFTARSIIRRHKQGLPPPPIRFRDILIVCFTAALVSGSIYLLDATGWGWPLLGVIAVIAYASSFLLAPVFLLWAAWWLYRRRRIAAVLKKHCTR